MDKITFDFENNTITFDMPQQRGTITEPSLNSRKQAIYAAAGLAVFDLSNTVNIVNAHLNGETTKEEFQTQLNAEKNEP